MHARFATASFGLLILITALGFAGWSLVLAGSQPGVQHAQEARQVRSYYAGINAYLISGDSTAIQASSSALSQGAAEELDPGSAELLMLAALRASYPALHYRVDTTGSVGGIPVTRLAAISSGATMPGWIDAEPPAGPVELMVSGTSIVEAASEMAAYLDLCVSADVLTLHGWTELAMVRIHLTTAGSDEHFFGLTSPGIYSVLSGKAVLIGNNVAEIVSPGQAKSRLPAPGEEVLITAGDTVVSGGGRAVVRVSSGVDVELIAALGISMQSAVDFQFSRLPSSEVLIRQAYGQPVFGWSSMELLTPVGEASGASVRQFSGGWLIVPPGMIVALDRGEKGRLLTHSVFNAENAEVIDQADRRLIVNSGDGALIVFVARAIESTSP